MRMKIEITQQTYLESLKYLCEELNKIIEQNSNINSIVSNGNICSILQDSFFYRTEKPNIIDTDSHYSIGSYNSLLLVIDKLQRWDDGNIYLKNNDEVILTIQLVDNNNVLI